MTKKQILATAILFGSLVSCHKARTYEATVELTRITAIRKDEQGAPISTDVEFSYVECPGSQIEVIRGGKDFSTCMSKHKVGEKVKIKLEHKWDPEGYYDYDVFEVSDCKRVPDPNDEASYKMVRQCSDWSVNGTRVGFQCNYADKKELNKKCPWFKTR